MPVLRSQGSPHGRVPVDHLNGQMGGDTCLFWAKSCYASPKFFPFLGGLGSYKMTRKRHAGISWSHHTEERDLARSICRGSGWAQEEVCGIQSLTLGLLVTVTAAEPAPRTHDSFLRHVRLANLAQSELSPFCSAFSTDEDRKQKLAKQFMERDLGKKQETSLFP